eukprot:scaffold73763_cov21-Tisochrysis_lutea.AAC.1
MAFAKEGTGIIFLESARCKGLACLYQPDGKLPVSSSAVKIASEQWKNCYLGDGKMGEYPVQGFSPSTALLTLQAPQI